jgi:hypothetical protein
MKKSFLMTLIAVLAVANLARAGGYCTLNEVGILPDKEFGNIIEVCTEVGFASRGYSPPTTQRFVQFLKDNSNNLKLIKATPYVTDGIPLPRLIKMFSDAPNQSAIVGARSKDTAALAALNLIADMYAQWLLGANSVKPAPGN